MEYVLNIIRGSNFLPEKTEAELHRNACNWLVFSTTHTAPHTRWPNLI